MVRIMMAGTPLATTMPEASAALIDQVISEVAAGLAEYEDDGGIAVPMQGWIVIAQK
jgi:hypothetical protein